MEAAQLVSAAIANLDETVSGPTVYIVHSRIGDRMGLFKKRRLPIAFYFQFQIDNPRSCSANHCSANHNRCIHNHCSANHNRCILTTGKTPSQVLFGSCMSDEKTPMLSEITETRDECDISEIRKEVKERIDTEQAKQKLAYMNTERGQQHRKQQHRNLFLCSVEPTD
ncbi:hypothetical protein ACJJTC_005487 [Scirpophaga incertulas]